MQMQVAEVAIEVQKKKIKKRRLKGVIYQALQDDEATEAVYRLVAEQVEEYP